MHFKGLKKMDTETELDTEIEEETEASLSDDLASAWDKSDDTEESSEVEVETEIVETEAEVETEPVKGEVVPAEVEGEEQAAPDTDQAPVGLPPEAREAWKDTPKAVKDAMAKREVDYATGMQKNAEGAKRAQQMDNTLAPYQQYFAMNGGPAQALQGLLQAGAGLQMGTPNQKAELIAGLISQFGVDITALDAVLVGNPAPAPQAEAQPSAQVQQQIDAAVAPFKQQMAQQQHNQQQAIGTELQSFQNDPKNEFYHDLKDNMANLLEYSANRGVDMSLKQAYDTSFQLRPDLVKIVGDRVSASTVAEKLRASSSISGTRGGEGGSNQATTTRGAIEEAWDNSGRM
jgi:hypothetical protein